MKMLEIGDVVTWADPGFNHPLPHCYSEMLGMGLFMVSKIGTKGPLGSPDVQISNLDGSPLTPGPEIQGLGALGEHAAWNLIHAHPGQYWDQSWFVVNPFLTAAHKVLETNKRKRGKLKPSTKTVAPTIK